MPQNGSATLPREPAGRDPLVRHRVPVGAVAPDVLGQFVHGALRRRQTMMSSGTAASSATIEKAEQCREGHVVEHAHQRAAGEPGHSVAGGEEAVRRRAPRLRHHLRHGRGNDQFVHAHAHAPQHHAGRDRCPAAGEGERRVDRRDDGQSDQHAEADSIEQPTEDQRAGATDRHRQGIEQRDVRRGDDAGAGEVEGDQREVGEAGRHQGCRGEIDPEHPRHAGRLHVRRWLVLHLFRSGVGDARDGERRQGQPGGQRQPGERGHVVALEGEDAGDRQRAQEGSDLVECLVQAKSETQANLAARVRQHHVARRVADGLAHPFEHDQGRGHGPVAGQRQCRHRGHLDDVADDRDRPELVGAVRLGDRRRCAGRSRATRPDRPPRPRPWRSHRAAPGTARRCCACPRRRSRRTGS